MFQLNAFRGSRVRDKQISRCVRAPLTALVAIALLNLMAAPDTPRLISQARAAEVSVATPDDASMPSSFADLVARVKPAVVNVSTTAKVSAQQPTQMPWSDMPDLPENSPFHEFFKKFFEYPYPQGGNEGPPAEAHALGSGFIVDPDGYVVTNNHVIEHADEIAVILNDGTRYPAELEGRDPGTDLALLKINPRRPLPYLQFGDSDVAREGDWVVAVGNPFGLGGTVTAGIISARGRDIHAGPFDDFLQIDAPINRGNSGGPLFDTHGDVIGINTAIFSPTGGNIGIGFAIPSSLAKPIIAQLRDRGEVERGWLGVTIQAITPEIAESIGLPEAEGALVASVVPNSPAAKAGIHTGDVIRRFDGQVITRMKSLPRLVASTKPGSRADVEVWREGGTEIIELTVTKRPSEEVLASKPMGESIKPGPLGLSVATITPELRNQYGLSDDAKGVLVVDIDPNGPAAAAGLKPGDIVLMAGQIKVSTPEDVTKQVEKAVSNKRSSVLLLINRGGDQQFVTVPLATS